ncbi:MAG: 16S rRNA (cytosine(1402)-N(4))-methyltransferase RsmH [Bacteroidales bacterium]|nr:16S rRNA (cytosine(1402)-N(4))-methyltransferase RsmH [Bacteroidales bacterium]
MRFEYHIPVLLKESINGLMVKPDGIYVDVTFGGGGHSKEILRRLTTGRLIAFDMDEDAKKNVIQNDRFLFLNQNFRFLKNNLKYYGINKIDGLIADLGVSSHHFDVEERGFSFAKGGSLDMRMNRKGKLTAKIVLETYTKERLKNVFLKYGEIHNSKRLAETIVNYRTNKEIEKIKEFISIIKSCVTKSYENKYLAKVFQALRIEVNRELENLKEMLFQTIDLIKTDGRLVVITYHSLEDRLVKNFIRKGKFEGELEKDIYGNVELPFDQVNKKVIIPGKEEIIRNSRARSAKLRIARRN